MDQQITDFRRYHWHSWPTSGPPCVELEIKLWVTTLGNAIVIAFFIFHFLFDYNYFFKDKIGKQTLANVKYLNPLTYKSWSCHSNDIYCAVRYLCSCACACELSCILQAARCLELILVTLIHLHAHACTHTCLIILLLWSAAVALIG